MSFSQQIALGRRYGLVVARLDVPLVITGAHGEVRREFRFDTGCMLTTVSEDVAALLGLPNAGTPVQIGGSTGTATGRLVSVVFRFPSDEISGIPEPNVTSTWVVTPGRVDLALLSLQDVHTRYSVGTDDTYMYFTNR